MRGVLLKRSAGGEEDFRWRGTEISRVENLSDAVFGFAITLLVVSSRVPETFRELTELLRLFVPFGACVLVFGMIWQAHYKFYRRYGLQDGTTMLINAALLFVMLFYLYPLKFLVTLLFNLFTGRHDLIVATAGDGDTLLAIYSAGYAAVFLLLAAFYGHAWRRREALELTPMEQLITKQTLGLMLVHVTTALLVLNIALLWKTTGMAGALYFLIGPLSYVVGTHCGRQMKALKTASPPDSEPPAG